LLDEPTNNLDADGLWHLQSLIQETEKTCVVISHDEDFLNSFNHQVLYLDIFSKKVETYEGDYYFVKGEIAKRIKRENAENARRKKKAQAKKDQANKFAGKGGGMRKVAKTMRGVADKMESELVNVRREDVSLKDFKMPFSRSESAGGELMTIEKVSSYQKSARSLRLRLQARGLLACDRTNASKERARLVPCGVHLREKPSETRSWHAPTRQVRHAVRLESSQ
jgi:ATPase subunit of ABC transporter with duplicated ATPase domains